MLKTINATTIQITVNSVLKINKKDWNTLIFDRFYLQLDYLEALENSVKDISEFNITLIGAVIYLEDMN